MNKKESSVKINKLRELLFLKDVFFTKERRLNFDYAFDLCDFLQVHFGFLNESSLVFFNSELDRLIELYGSSIH